jgi:hypothetical protein
VALQFTTASAGVSTEALAQLPALVVGRNTFEQAELRAKVGEAVALRLDNQDTNAHSFDIDEFAVHTLLPPGATSLALFTASRSIIGLRSCLKGYLAPRTPCFSDSF